MAGVAAANPRQQFLDTDGNPLAGGFVHTYLAGTTTATTTWQDRAQTTANTNPIELDAAGSCLLWLDSALTYKFVVTDASGVTQSHLGGDNIVGAAGPSILADALADVEAAKDAAVAELETLVAEGEAAQAAAEAARDSINTTGKVFASTAAGISGTTDGQTFAVLSTDAQSWVIYENDGGVAVEVASSYTKAFVDAFYDVSFSRADRAWALVDEEGGEILYVDENGDLSDRNNNISESVAELNSAVDADSSYDLSQYVHAWTDEDMGLFGGFDTDGDLRILDASGEIGKAVDIFQAAGTYRNETKGLLEIACFGDSLTQGSGAVSTATYPYVLGTLTGLSVANRGVSAYNAERIACTQGGLVSLFTFPSNTIPASGGVEATDWTHEVRGDLAPTSIAGSLLSGGVFIPGTLTWSTGPVYTFTRTTAGDEIEVDELTPFIVDQNSDDYKIQVWWAGRNGFSSDPTGAQMIEYYELMEAMLKPAIKRFVILGIINGIGTSGRESVGTTAYNQIVAINAAVKARFPNNFIDIRKVLIRNYDSGDAQDVTDHTDDLVPDSLRADDIHLNADGYAIVAQTVHDFINAKGWLA